MDTQPTDRLKDASQDLLRVLGDRAVSSLTDRVGGLTDKLEGLADASPAGSAVAKGAKKASEGGSPLLGAVTGAASGLKDKAVSGVKDMLPGGGSGGGSGGGGKATKSTNIIESIDVGVPIRVAYNQWTEFGSFPTFMKKVENVDAEEDDKLEFKAQIFLSHRTWEATVLEQIPDERIVWRSKGEKGHVDGAVTFHELGPNLTRILVVLEYYPKGLFEKTGNIWRAQGRRARAELRHFRRHVMTRTILDPEEIEGWRGLIEDGEVVKTHEEAVEEEESEESPEGDDEESEYDEPEESGEGEPEDDYEEAEDEEPEEAGDEEPEDLEDEEAEDDEPEEAEPEEDEPEEDEDEDEEPEDLEEEYEEAPEEEETDEEEEEPEDELEEDEYVEDEEEYEDEPEPTRRGRRAS